MAGKSWVRTTGSENPVKAALRVEGVCNGGNGLLSVYFSGLRIPSEKNLERKPNEHGRLRLMGQVLFGGFPPGIFELFELFLDATLVNG